MKLTIEKLEILRKKGLQRIIIGIILTIFIVVITLIVVIPSMTSIIQIMGFGIFGLVGGSIITSIISFKPIKRYELGFKEVFVHSALKKIFNNVVYNPEEGLNKSVIGHTGMMNMGDKYSSNDYVSAEYKGIKFTQADVHIEERRTKKDKDGKTETYYETIFRGKWMVFDFNKNFKADVQVYTKWFSNATRNNTSNGKFQKIELENAEFNKSFRTYAQSQHDAFYILTPHIMEKIQNLSNNISGNLLLCFIDNKLHVGIQNRKKSFEASIWTKINEEKILEKINSEINIITQFVDELNLDNDLFRKEEI